MKVRFLVNLKKNEPKFFNIVNRLRSSAPSLNEQIQIDMDMISNNITIDSIIFTSNDTEVLLKGTIERGHLSHDTQLVITQTQLNIIMNSLQKQNDQFEIEDCLRSQVIGRNETLFYASFDHLTNSKIDIQSIIDSNEITQIRA